MTMATALAAPLSLPNAAPRAAGGAWRGEGRSIVVARGFDHGEIGWIAADLHALALRRGIAPDAIARGVALDDAHLDGDHLLALASHPRLLTRVRRLADAQVAIAASRLRLDSDDALPPIEASIVATVLLDTRPPVLGCAGGTGRFGAILIRPGAAPPHEEEVRRGTSLQVVYVPFGRIGAVPAPVAEVDEQSLWPSAHLPCG
ncbi:MAG: hypothetical protein AB7O45_03390 [Alphaproteobacteria bacterium]